MKKNYWDRKREEVRVAQRRLDTARLQIQHDAERVDEIPKPNLFDRVVGVFSPQRLLQNMGARYSAFLLERELEGWNERTAYKAAEVNRLNANWNAVNQDVNDYLVSELPRIRARSRWLFRNNPHAGQYMNAILNYGIGVGFTLQMQVRRAVNNDSGVEFEYLDAANDFVEDLFADWAEDVDVNASETTPESFEDIQTLCMRKLIEDGEFFIHTGVDLTHSVVPFRMEIIEPDSLDMSITEYQGRPVKMGIEIDPNTWRPLAYWIYSGRRQFAPYVNINQSIRVPAEDMLHVFLKLRPRQLRGVPFLAATTPKIFDLDEYSDAELIGNKIAACLAVIITQPAGEPDSDLLAGKTGQALTDMKGNPIRNLEPGMIGVTRQGAGVNVVSPQKPGTTFGMFMRYNQNLIGTGAQYGISYLTMTRDMQGVTHAGGRLAQQMDFQAIRPLQRWFSRKMCRNIFNTWHSVAVMAGKIKAPGYFQDKAAMRFWRRHMWMPGGWHLGTNPLQEIEASVQSMRAGITTPDDECARLGHDADTQLMKIRRYQRKARKYGVVVESDAAVGRISRQGAAPTTDEDGATKLEDLNNGEQT